MRVGKRMIFISVCDIGISEEQKDMLREMFTKPTNYNFIDPKEFKPLKIYWPAKSPKF